MILTKVGRVPLVLVIASVTLAVSGCASRAKPHDYSLVSNYSELFAAAHSDKYAKNSLRWTAHRLMQKLNHQPKYLSNGFSFDQVLGTEPSGLPNAVTISGKGTKWSFRSYRPLTDFVASDYKAYPIHGNDSAFARADGSIRYSLSKVMDGVWLEEAAPIERVGNASCEDHSSTSSRFHIRRSFEDLTIDERNLLADLVAYPKSDIPQMCGIYRNEGDGRWRRIIYSPEGDLLMMNLDVGTFRVGSRAEAKRIALAH